MTEGFDAPITKGVCLMHVPDSNITICQILGRCLRKHTSKKMANIMFPICNTEETDIITKVTKMLCDNDDKYKNNFTKKKVNGFIEVYHPCLSYMNDADSTNYIAEHLYDYTMNSLGELISDVATPFKKRLDELDIFIVENNKTPSMKSKNINEKTLGNWLSQQKKNYSKRRYNMKDESIRTIWEEFMVKYSQYFKTNY